MNEFVVAIGLVFMIEGLLYALMAGKMKEMALQILETEPQTLRIIGVGSILIGAVIVKLAM